MKKIIFLLIFLVSAGALSAEECGVFLKLPLSPRAGGMGDASAALADEPFGLYYNPAGMAYAEHPVVSLVYHKYLQDISGNSLALVYPFKKFTLGVAPTLFSMKEEPVYDSLGADTGEKFGYESKIISVAIARKIGNLAVGVAGKSYSEDMSGQAAATTAYDIGAIYKFDRFSFGAAIQNLGGKLYEYELAKVERLGAAYTKGKYTAAADFKKEGEDKASFGFGGAYALAGALTLRGGWRFKEEFGGITFGLGAGFKGFTFDYAFLSYGDLGATHKAGVSFAFGAKARKPAGAVVTPVQPAVVNSAPELAWTGEENYTTAGISTGTGNTTTPFVYRVKYLDADNDAPAAGYPKLHITRGGSEVSGSPYGMEYAGGNNKTGAIYAHMQRLPSGADYAYYFEARDSSGTAAAGAPTLPAGGPAVTRYEAEIITGGTNIAVADFIGKNVSQADASIVADFLRTELVSTRLFNVMDRNNMDTIMAEQKFQTSGCTEQDCAVEIGKLLNVKHMLVGSLSKLLDSYYITVNVVDVESGKIVASYDSEPVTSTGLKDACKKIVDKLVHN